VKGNQPAQIKLYRTKRILKYRKKYKNGFWAEWPEKSDFKIGSTSKLPPALYKPIWYNLKSRLDGLIDNGQPFKRCAEAAVQRLNYWGKTYNCDCSATDHGLIWNCLEDKCFLEYLIVDLSSEGLMTWNEALDHLRKSSHTAGRRFQRLEEESEAMLRVAILIFSDGPFWLSGKTLPKESK
jgi:hypothetical protein